MGLLTRVTAYYVGLGVAVALVYLVWPDLADRIGEELYAGSGSLSFDSAAAQPISSGAAPALLISMINAIVLMIPVSWVYMGTRKKQGFQQSVVQTVMLLPIAVAGVVVIVQNSVALAFSLAGIVAAVRFRTTLKDKLDALYIFVAIGVGLASGIGALAIALVLSLVFSYANVAVWAVNYGYDGGVMMRRRQEARHDRWMHREAVRTVYQDEDLRPDMNGDENGNGIAWFPIDDDDD